MVDTHIFKGRAFTFQGIEPYTRKNGTQTALQVWHGACAHDGCTSPVVVKIPQACPLDRARNFGMIHCADHKLTRAEVRLRGAIAQCKAKAKVSDQDVADIRAWAASGLTASDLTLTYPLTRGTIREIITGRRR